MQLTAKLKAVSSSWNDLLRPRVGEVADDGLNYYSNISGYNGALSDDTVWFPIGSVGPSSGGTLEVDKTAANVGGSDPIWTIDLSSDGMPDFPVSFSAYIDTTGDLLSPDFQKFSSDNYDANTKILSGLPSPTDFPNMLIKLFVI